MIDVLIVGEGLAACVSMHALNRSNLTFKCIGVSHLSSCSRIAAGIWNPVVFKRMTESWLAYKLIPELKTFYTQAEMQLGIRCLYEMPIVRVLSNLEAQKTWKNKSANALAEWIQPVDVTQDENWRYTSAFNIRAYVNQTGYLDVNTFINASIKYFSACYQNAVFQYQQLNIYNNYIEYQGLKAKHIIFCEGYRVLENPYFNWIPLKPAKGEVIQLDCPALVFNNAILNSNGFLMPRPKGQYILGATYTWDFENENPSEEGYRALEEKAKSMVRAPFNLTAHRGGIRPASIDRRPIIGPHPVYGRLWVCNGLGAKGVMLAPFVIKQLVDSLAQPHLLDDAISIKRFYNKYSA